MKRWWLLALLLMFQCSQKNFPPRECGDSGYSHFVNFPEVYRAARKCDLAYKDDDSINTEYQFDRVQIRYLKDSDSKYFVTYDDMQKRQYIAIRGTASFENAKTDGKYRKVKSDKLTNYDSKVIDQSVVENEKLDVWVHRGFNATGTEVYNDIIKNKLLEKNYETHVTGHSLGAATAVVVYLNLMVDGYTLGMLYTFGQPKLFAADGVLKYRCIPCMRVVNENDMVPLIPPTKFGFGLITSIPLWRHGKYRHLGDQIILLKDSSYVYLEYEQAEQVNVTSFWNNLGKGDVSLHDHHMPSYLANLSIKRDVITERKYKDRKEYE